MKESPKGVAPNTIWCYLRGVEEQQTTTTNKKYD